MVIKVTEWSNNYAVSVNDLSTAIQKSSASLATGNNTLEEAIALNAAGIEILQEAGRTANGLSTITARLTASHDEYIRSITKGEGVIDSQTGELRSTFAILHDLADAWEGLTSVEQQELTEVVAGKTQRSLFTALMTNFSTAVGAAKDALEAEGSAMRENEKRMDSLQGHINQLTTAWEKLASETLDSSFVKSILDAGTAILKLVDAIGGLAPILTIVFGLILKFNAASIVKSVIGLWQRITGLNTGLFDLKVKLTEARLELVKAQVAGDTAAITLARNQAQIASVTLALSSLLSVLSSVLIVTTIVTTAVKAYNDAVNEEREKLAEAANEATNTVSTLEDIRKRYVELILSQEDEVKKQEQLKALQKELNEAVKYNNLDLYNASLEQVNASLDEMVKNEKALADIKLNTLLDDADKALGEREGLLGLFSRIGKSLNIFAQESRNLALDYQVAINSIGTSTSESYFDQLNALSASIKQNTKKAIELQETGYEEDATKVLKFVETQKNAVKYILDRAPEIKTAYDALYKAATEGSRELTSDQIWMMEILDYNLDVYYKKIGGIEEAEKRAAQAKAKYIEEMEKASKASENYQSQVDSEIEMIASYQERLDILTAAQKEYSEANSLTAETYQKLKDNDLLQYLSNVGGNLEFNTGALYDDTEAAKENAETALKNAYAQDVLQLELAAQNGTLEETAAKLGLVTTTSNGVDTSHAVNQIGNVATAATEARLALAKFNDILAGGTGEDVRLYDEDTERQLNEYTKQLQQRLQKNLDIINTIKIAPSGKGTKSKKGSTKKEYEPTINALYEYENAVEIAKGAVDKFNKAISNTKKLDEQEYYIRNIIPALQDQINATNNLRNAQSNQIENYIEQLRRYGFQIDYTASTNELYIRNMYRLGQYTGDTAKVIEKMIKNIQDMNKDNRTLDNSVQDLTKSVADYYKQLEDFPEKRLKKFQEVLSDFQQNVLQQSEYIKEDIEHQLKSDPRIKSLNQQIEALKKQNEEINKQKELEEKLLAVEEAKQKLANALTQRTVHLLTEEGWDWVPDIDVVEDAVKDLNQAQDDLEKQRLESQIEALEAERDAIEKLYQDEIDIIEEFLTERNYQIDKANRTAIQSFDDLTKALQENGIYYQEFIQKSIDWINEYNDAAIKTNLMRDQLYASAGNIGNNELIYSSAMQNRLDKALSGFTIDTTGQGVTIRDLDYSQLGADGGQNIYIDNLQLPDVRNVDEFMQALKDLPRKAASKATSRK